MALGIVGKVWLSVLIGTDGRVASAQIARSLDPTLDAMTLLAIAKWRFKPAVEGANPVPVQVTVEMEFTLR